MTAIKRVSDLGTRGTVNIADNSVTTPKIASNAVVQADLSTNIPLSGLRNTIINGDMRIAQRAISFSNIEATNNYFTVDRWKTTVGLAGIYTQTQSTDAPAGFGNSLKMECTTASGALGSSAFGYIQQLIEGQNLQDFAKGTSNAKPFMVSFWVKASQSGTYVVALRDFSNNRLISRTYTLDASATWEYKTIQFPADTVGALANTNTGALALSFWFTAGTNWTTGTSNGNWNTSASANHAAGLNVNIGSTVGNYFQITGVQLEQNTQPTPFEQRPIGVELALCQRYYWRINGNASAYARISSCGSTYSGTSWQGWVLHPTPMRIAATSIDWSGIGVTDNVGYDSTSFVTLNLNVNNGTPITAFLSGAGASSINANGAGHILILRGNASSYIGFNAEL